jgi:hypothetical protein
MLDGGFRAWYCGASTTKEHDMDHADIHPDARTEPNPAGPGLVACIGFSIVGEAATEEEARAILAASVAATDPDMAALGIFMAV